MQDAQLCSDSTIITINDDDDDHVNDNNHHHDDDDDDDDDDGSGDVADAYEDLLRATSMLRRDEVVDDNEDIQTSLPSNDDTVKKICTDSIGDIDAKSVIDLSAVNVLKQKSSHIDSALVIDHHHLIPSSQDNDIAQLMQQIDTAHQLIRNNASMCVLEIKAKLIKSATDERDENAREYRCQLEAKQQCIEDLKERLAVLDSSQRHADMKDSTRLHATDICLIKLRSRNVVERVFSSWKRAVNERNLFEKTHRVLVAPLQSQQIVHKFFSKWIHQSHISHTLRREKHWKNEVEIVTHTLVTKYEDMLQKIRLELSQAQKEVSFHLQNKQNMQREMKQAFMRSVSALNLEAMSMFSTQNTDALSSLGLHKPSSQSAKSTEQSADNDKANGEDEHDDEDRPRTQVPIPSWQ